MENTTLIYLTHIVVVVAHPLGLLGLFLHLSLDERSVVSTREGPIVYYNAIELEFSALSWTSFHKILFHVELSGEFHIG